MHNFDKVFLIGVDGAGCFFTQTETPEIDRIFKYGAYNNRVLTSEPTISAECWGSMLHGVLPKMHKLTNGIVSHNRLKPSYAFPSVFKVAREVFPDAVLASYCCWNPINYGIIESNLGVVEDTAGDEELTEKIVAHIENNDTKFLFVQFDSVDGAGHHFGYGTRGHLDAITRADGYIGKIYDTLKRRDMLENALFMVTADHGGTPDGHHGGSTDAEKYVSFYAVGKGVVNGEIGDMQVQDIAGITLAALGVPQPEEFTSRIPDSLFEGVSGCSRPAGKYTPVLSRPEHENRPTPDNDGERLIDFIDEKKLLAYYAFDGNLNDFTGKSLAGYDGKIYYPQGYFSSCLRLDDCSVTIDAPDFGTESFTLMFWLKRPLATDDSAVLVFSNKTEADEQGKKSGISVKLKEREIEVSVSDGKNTNEYQYAYPDAYADSWFHFAFCVDREKSCCRAYIDFDCAGEDSVRVPFDADLPIGSGKFVIGNNATLNVDDFIAVGSAVSGGDIEKISRYYK